jgi:hypothetical protein
MAGGKWTIFRRHTNSADAVSQTRFVAVNQALDEALRALRAFRTTHPHTGRAEVANNPDRVWWPADPPAALRTTLSRLVAQAQGVETPVVVSALPGRDSGGDYSSPRYDNRAGLTAQTLFMSDSIEMYDVQHSPFAL